MVQVILALQILGILQVMIFINSKNWFLSEPILRATWEVLIPKWMTGSLHMQLALLQNRGPRDDHNMWGRLYKQKKTTSHFCALRWYKLGHVQFKLSCWNCCFVLFAAFLSSRHFWLPRTATNQKRAGRILWLQNVLQMWENRNPMPVASNFPIIFPTLDSAMNRSSKPGFLREYLLL